MTAAVQSAIERLKSDLGVSSPRPTRQPDRKTATSPGSVVEPETPEAIAKLKSALELLSPDVPRGNGSVLVGPAQPTHDYWLGVIWAIAGLNWSCGEAIAREWSRKSPRYDPDAFTKDWAAYNPDHSSPVGIGSVYKLARAHGWRDAQPVAPPGNSLRYRVLKRDEIFAIPPIQWLVKGLLPTSGLAAIYGPSGSGKSFLALDLAFAIASGEPWFDRRTVQCNVTYVMLEGEAGLHNRVAAWERHRTSECPAGFGAIPQPFGLMDDHDVADLGAVLPSGGVVIIDTLNRAAPTADENSSSDMGRILEGAKRLQQMTGGLVVLVHHTGKDTSKGLRGHSSLFAALDAGIEVERSATGRSWRVGKAKDGEDGTVVPFALKRVVLDVDADGDDVASCVVEPCDVNLFAPPEPSGENQRTALRAVRECLRSAEERGKGGSGAACRCITFEQGRAAIAAAFVNMASNKRKHEAKRYLNELVQRGFLQSGTDAGEVWVWDVQINQSEKSPLIGGTDF